MFSVLGSYYMKKKLILIYILFSPFISSCSNPTENVSEKILVSKLSNSLKTTNTSNQTIYIFIIEQDYAARINWAPLYDGPNIKPGESIIVYYNNIPDGINLPVKTGDKAILYYWIKPLNIKPRINSMVVQLSGSS